MKIVALLTGRGNNTLKDKNVLLVHGKPLLYFPAIMAKRSLYINDFYVSSDDEKILKAGAKLGYKRIVRPAELAMPDSQHVDAILHALKEMKKDGIEPDILVVLLANSATVKTQWIDACIRNILDNPDISASVPVYEEMDDHPYRAKKLDSEGFLATYIDFKGQKVSTNRQDLPKNYFLCHNFWVLNVKKSVYCEGGQPPWLFMGNKIKPLIVQNTFDVHTREDIANTSDWLERNVDLNDILQNELYEG